MKKASILMAAVLFGGAVACVWADDLNPQPLPPGVTQATAARSGPKVTKHKPSPGTNSGKTKRLLPVTHIGGDGGKNLTLHDSKQIQGNINGGSGKNSLNNSVGKDAFLKTGAVNGTSKSTISGFGAPAH